MKYHYITAVEQPPAYYQYPKFLLHLQISATAKTIYMLLLDRARLSQKNHWIDDQSRVYLIYPIDELVLKSGKSKTTVKKTLHELVQTGLLTKKTVGFSKPNHLYLMIPDEAETSNLSEETKTARSCTGSRNPTLYGAEKRPYEGRKCDPTRGGNVTPSKNNKSNTNLSKNDLIYRYKKGESL